MLVNANVMIRKINKTKLCQTLLSWSRSRRSSCCTANCPLHVVLDHHLPQVVRCLPAVTTGEIQPLEHLVGELILFPSRSRAAASAVSNAFAVVQRATKTIQKCVVAPQQARTQARKPATNRPLDHTDCATFRRKRTNHFCVLVVAS